MYDYKESITNDVLEAIKEDFDPEDLNDWNRTDFAEELRDRYWNEDHITGNASGSYWCNAYKARECIMEDNNAEDYIHDLIDEFGIDSQTIADNFLNWEYWDVSIRCYLLAECIEDALDELEMYED